MGPKRPVGNVAARVSLLTAYLELMEEGNEEGPAPWCWDQYVETGTGLHPPFYPGSLEGAAHERSAMKDFVEAYGRSENRNEFLRRLSPNQKQGKKLVEEWLRKDARGCRVNTRIDGILEEDGINPISITSADGTSMMTKEQVQADRYLQEIAVEFFGGDAFGSRRAFLRLAVTDWVRGMLTLTWNRWRQVFRLAKKKVEEAKGAYEAASAVMKEVEYPTHGQVKGYLSAVEKWSTQLQRWKEVRVEEWEAVQSELEVIELALTKQLTKEDFIRLPPALKSAWQFLPSMEDSEQYLAT
ncbi:hypothetical protein L226DRAFT_573359, partial [Lentinus tigrinus ALCF2SS1-7]|uniref:uncharacterized protein n=1 Tax=Lentinus tigrinus ALCF2SS1-7 TaxID=1328758 RepID=UPI0011660C59